MSKYIREVIKMKVMIITNGCELENAILERNEDDFDYYDRIIDNEKDEEAISYFENNYSEYKSEYFDIVEIPSNATDCIILPHEEFTEVLVIIDGKIEVIYDNEGDW